ncbi:MAG: hypothetical protein AB7G93_21105 [Bdellovibrionales bacterium]
MYILLAVLLVFVNSAAFASTDSSAPQSLTIVGPDADELAKVVREAGAKEDGDKVTFQTISGGLKIECNHTGFVPVCTIQKVAPN